MFSYEYPRPALASDCIVFAFTGKTIEVLLIQRKKDPDKGKWALPGGFVEENETSEAGCLRELQEETGLLVDEVALSGVYSAPKRDPRSRVVSVAYFTLIAKPEKVVEGGDDAEEARWFPINNLPPLAFDHDTIFKDAYNHLKKKACFSPIGLGILSSPFTIEELRKLYEAILQKEINPRTLQRKLMKMDYLKKNADIDTLKKSTAKLLTFDTKRYLELLDTGFYLDLNEKK